MTSGEQFERAVIHLLHETGKARVTTEETDAALPLITRRFMPPDPTACWTVTCYDTADTFNPNELHKWGRVQVRIRAATLPESDNALETIRGALDVTHRNTPAMHIQRCFQTSYVWLGKNETGHFEATLNYEIIH